VSRLTANTQRAVVEAATGIQTLASQIAPIDTGALRNSIYVNTGSDSDYSTRVATSRGLNRDMIPLDELSPEFVIPLAGSNTGNVAVVGVAAHYGLFLEEGTVFQPPQPFMRPASESVSDDFQQAMQRVADGI
jgi:HK97 gp10 family phage protein